MSTSQDLISACKKGDRKAQHTLYKMYAGKLLSVAWRYMKVRQEAEDVLQESFIKIFGKLDTFKEESSLETWMRRIVVNTALNHQRSKLYMYPMFDITDIDDHHIPLALDHLAENEILDLVNDLPEGCRLIFNLYAIEGYKHKEIADMLSINEGTSKSQLARAKKLLQESIIALDRHRKYKQ